MIPMIRFPVITASLLLALMPGCVTKNGPSASDYMPAEAELTAGFTYSMWKHEEFANPGPLPSELWGLWADEFLSQPPKEIWIGHVGKKVNESWLTGFVIRVGLWDSDRAAQAVGEELRLAHEQAGCPSEDPKESVLLRDGSVLVYVVEWEQSEKRSMEPLRGVILEKHSGLGIAFESCRP